MFSCLRLGFFLPLCFVSYAVPVPHILGVPPSGVLVAILKWRIL